MPVAVYVLPGASTIGPDCRVGWLVANIRHPELREWLKMRLRCHYHPKGEAHGPPKVRGPVA